MTEQKYNVQFEVDEFSLDEMNEFINGTLAALEEGDLVTGTVVKIERDEVLVDIGYKSEGVIPARELSIRKDANAADLVVYGEKIEALVLQMEDKEGRLILSKKRAEYERAWVNVEKMFEDGQNVEGEVIEVVKGGLIVDIGLRGFLPASLVDLRRVKDLQSFLGDRIEARIIEMDRNRNNVVLSRRVILEDSRKQDRGEILSQLQKGMILPGHISSVVDFGAFVDLGGIDGLVHISELSWNHVNHPSEVVKVGDAVNVQVLDVDLQRERISLGLKQTTEDPWKAKVEAYPVESIHEGRVTKLVPFGIFVDLGDGIEGLVHISEMAQGHVETPDQVCKVGDTVQVKVMGIEQDRRRISLSMRAAAEDLGITIEITAKEAPAESEAELEGAAVAEGVEGEVVVEADADEAPAAEAEVEETVEVPAADAEVVVEVAEGGAEFVVDGEVFVEIDAKFVPEDTVEVVAEEAPAAEAEVEEAAEVAEVEAEVVEEAATEE